MSDNNGLTIIDAVTQFVGGTQALWNQTTIPVPAGLVVYAPDTTVLKIGDGVTLYSALPSIGTLSGILSGASIPSAVSISDVSSIVPAVKGAQSVIVVSFNEFDLNTTVVSDSSGNSFNASYDQLVKTLPLASCQSNFIYTVEKDLSPITEFDTVMLWVQDFTPYGSSNVPNIVEPAINGSIATSLSSPTNWNSQGKTAATALNLVGTQGGTTDDASFLSGARYLVERGYNVGLYPIVLGWDNTIGLPNSTSLTWRGYFTWPDITTFNTWLTSYTAFILYYVELLYNNGLPLKRCCLGSEFVALTESSPNDQWSAWVSGLESLAQTILGYYPNCEITYAANYSDYSVGGTFRLDSLWSSPYINFVGIDWYQPLTISPTDSAISIRNGLKALENFDFTTIPDNTQRSLSGSLGLGKSSLAQTKITPSEAIKNISGFFYNGHYLSPLAGNIAEATPLAGYDRTYNPYGLGLMQGTGIVQVSGSPFVAPATSGLHPIPLPTNKWLLTDGTSTYGYFNLPTYTSGTVNSFEMSVSWQLTNAAPVNFARLIECLGYFELYVNGTEITLGLGVNGTGEQNYNICLVDTNVHNLSFIVTYGTTPTLSITIDGITTQYSITTGAVIPASSVTCYVGGYNATSNLIAAKIFNLGIQMSSLISGSSVIMGGQFNFEEAYAGVRTAWVPKSKKILITEVGFASTSGTSVEPSQFPYADYGTPVVTLPSFLNAATKSLLEAAIATGWYPKEIYGPYGATFNVDQTEQYNALSATCEYFLNLKNANVIHDTTIYCIDARPSASMLALKGGTYYYQDGPLAAFSHAINGKISGGGFWS